MGIMIGLTTQCVRECVFVFECVRGQSGTEWVSHMALKACKVNHSAAKRGVFGVALASQNATASKVYSINGQL